MASPVPRPPVNAWARRSSYEDRTAPAEPVAKPALSAVFFVAACDVEYCVDALAPGSASERRRRVAPESVLELRLVAERRTPLPGRSVCVRLADRACVAVSQ